MKKVIQGIDGLTGISSNTTTTKTVKPKPKPKRKITNAKPKKTTEPKKKVGRPKSVETENETRATFIVNNDILNEMKAIAKIEGVNFKAVVGESFKRFIIDYKKKKGTIDTSILKKKSIL